MKMFLQLHVADQHQRPINIISESIIAIADVVIRGTGTVVPGSRIMLSSGFSVEVTETFKQVMDLYRTAVDKTATQYEIKPQASP